eukprot:scaffold5231_cov83-Cylindrotheca_fusiformis.AAC.5
MSPLLALALLVLLLLFGSNVCSRCCSRRDRIGSTNRVTKSSRIRRPNRDAIPVNIAETANDGGVDEPFSSLSLSSSSKDK